MSHGRIKISRNLLIYPFNLFFSKLLLAMAWLCIYSFKNNNNKDDRDQASCYSVYELLVDGRCISDSGCMVVL